MRFAQLRVLPADFLFLVRVLPYQPPENSLMIRDASRQCRSNAALNSLCSPIAVNRFEGPTWVGSSLLKKYPRDRFVSREKKSRATRLNRSDVPSFAKASCTSAAVGPNKLGALRPASDQAVSDAACCAISPRSVRLPVARTWRSTARPNAAMISIRVGSPGKPFRPSARRRLGKSACRAAKGICAAARTHELTRYRLRRDRDRFQRRPHSQRRCVRHPRRPRSNQRPGSIFRDFGSVPSRMWPISFPAGQPARAAEPQPPPGTPGEPESHPAFSARRQSPVDKCWIKWLKHS